jgi:hypothetical protein
MSMSAETHPDPFRDAMGHGLQRAMQIASCAVTAAQVYIYQQRNQAAVSAARDERTRRVLDAQIRADREAARAGWAPALDPAWLRQADLFQTARVWGHAMPYADRSAPWYEPAATTAMRKAEDRLRDLHPYAMSHYDRLRTDGTGPAEAMREAAPLFARPARAYDTPYTPRPVLTMSSGEPLIWAATEPPPGPDKAASLALAQAQERRGMRIAAALQARAAAQHRGPLGADELRTVLETVTNLPADVINHVVQPAGADGLPRPRNSAVLNPGSPRPSATSRPWKQDFPTPINDVVATAALSRSEHPAAAKAPAQPRSRGRHRR